MIVARETGGLRVVLQVDHQVQCRAAADAWGNDRFSRLDPWDPVAEAAAVHDEGWRPWEQAPQVDARGRPVDFPDLDRVTHLDLYRRGIAFAVSHGARVGLLVSMHGEGLYRSRLGLDGPPAEPADLAPVARAFVAEQHALQDRLRGDLGDGPQLNAWAWAGYRLLQAWDRLSLYLTWRGLPAGRDGRLRAVPRGIDDADGVDLALRHVDDRTVSCDPFPFAGDEARVPVIARVIPDRVYASDGDLREALALAEAVRLEYRVVG